jgi:hypothetical protein
VFSVCRRERRVARNESCRLSGRSYVEVRECAFPKIYAAIVRTQPHFPKLPADHLRSPAFFPSACPQQPTVLLEMLARTVVEARHHTV